MTGIRWPFSRSAFLACVSQAGLSSVAGAAGQARPVPRPGPHARSPRPPRRERALAPAVAAVALAQPVRLRGHVERLAGLARPQQVERLPRLCVEPPQARAPLHTVEV